MVLLEKLNEEGLWVWVVFFFRSRKTSPLSNDNLNCSIRELFAVSVEYHGRKL